MAVKSSIHIKPCNISSSEAHNLRTPEYMRNIGESKIYLIPQLVADNEYWINPRFGDPLAALGIVQASLSSALVCTGVLRGEAHKRSAERSLCTLGRAHNYFKRSV